MMKTCSKCNEEKDASSFPTKGAQCRSCRAAYMRNYNEKREADTPGFLERKGLAQRMKRYGLTVEKYDALLDSQGRGCAICGSFEPGGYGTWHIDHDHACCPEAESCGECVRGLLCAACNVGIGNLRDDPNILLAAAAYLLQRANVLGTPI